MPFFPILDSCFKVNLSFKLRCRAALNYREGRREVEQTNRKKIHTKNFEWKEISATKQVLFFFSTSSSSSLWVCFGISVPLCCQQRSTGTERCSVYFFFLVLLLLGVIQFCCCRFLFCIPILSYLGMLGSYVHTYPHRLKKNTRYTLCTTKPKTIVLSNKNNNNKTSTNIGIKSDRARGYNHQEHKTTTSAKKTYNLRPEEQRRQTSSTRWVDKGGGAALERIISSKRQEKNSNEIELKLKFCCKRIPNSFLLKAEKKTRKENIHEFKVYSKK